MSADSELTRTQREVIALYSLRLNRCGYCVESHASVLAGLGIDEAAVNALANGAMQPLDDDLRQILAFAGKRTLEPGNDTAAAIEAVRASGCSDRTIEDVMGVVATFAFPNRRLDGFGIEATAEHFKQVGGIVSQQGYMPFVQMIQQKAAAGRE